MMHKVNCIVVLLVILMAGCSKKTDILGPGCECYFNFNENWEESVSGEEYVTDDGEPLPKDPRIVGEKNICLTMWNQEKLMSLQLVNFIDDETMMLSDSEILKVIKTNLEIESTPLGYVLKEESEYRFFNKDLHMFIAELGVGGNYQIDLVEIKDNRCIIIHIMGEKTEEIFEELDILQKHNPK